MASWGCHTCAGRGVSTIHTAPFVWLARRRSIRHEKRAHAFSVYTQRGPRVTRALVLMLALAVAMSVGAVLQWLLPFGAAWILAAVSSAFLGAVAIAMTE